MFALCLCACSESEDSLSLYRESMESFYTTVSDIDDRINAIDPESEDASDTLLTELDRLEQAFDDMAQVEIPEEFSMIGELPDEAASYMERAVAAYHSAYDGEFDAEAEALASQYYERANVRIRYMLAILHGEEELTVETHDAEDAEEMRQESAGDSGDNEDNGDPEGSEDFENTEASEDSEDSE